MLWNILGLIVALAVMWVVYTYVFKPFSGDLAAMGFNFYGLIGKIIMVVSCLYFLAATFFDLVESSSLPAMMFMGIVILSPGYIVFFLRCLAKTKNIGYTAVALVFMIFISLMAGYLATMIVGLVIVFFFFRAALAPDNGAAANGVVTCSSCGKSVRIYKGGNGPYTCPHCNLTV
jgi:hypothetical protein